jgi:hypothetical protein
MYVSIPCNVANGAVYDPAALAKSAAQRAKTDAATTQAQAAYSGLLCRNPADFLRFGRTVAVDVQVTNAETGCQPGQSVNMLSSPNAAGAAAIAGSGGAAGGNGTSGGAGSSRGSARSGLYRVGGPGGIAASCDLSSEYAVSETPLNGPGVTSLPEVSARPAVLTAPGLPKPGMGKWGDGRRRLSRGGAMRARGVGSCCSGFPAWGDAFPAGSPSSASGSALSLITAWISANPWLTIGLGAAGVFLMAGTGSRGRRG